MNELIDYMKKNPHCWGIWAFWYIIGEMLGRIIF